MGDYHSWLDNIAAADMRASKYFVDKVQVLYTVDPAILMQGPDMEFVISGTCVKKKIGLK